MKLFTKTYINDWPWLKLAMKSVLKTCGEDIEWVIVVDDGTAKAFQDVVNQAVQEARPKMAVSVRVAEVSESYPEAPKIQSGYMRQQWIKMNAHRVMGSGLFFNWDSDVIAVKPFSQKTFCNPQGKPIHWFSQINHLLTSEKDQTAVKAHNDRRFITEMVLDYRHVCFEWMRCMPVPMIGQILEHASTQDEWKRAFQILESGDHRLSEFNIIGQYCHLYYPDAFDWRNSESHGPTWSGGYVTQGSEIVYQEHAFVAQGWSYGGIPLQVAQYVDAL